jgi:hypothetical protein
VNLALLGFKIEPVERLNSSERFADAAHFEKTHLSFHSRRQKRRFKKKLIYP